MVSIGTIVWLSSELMFFAALFAMYFTLRAVNPEVWAADTQVLNIPFASVNTTILVLSSVTCQLGVFAAERGDVKGLRRWFIITFVMGSIFIGGQVFEYAELVHYGLTPSSSAYGSAFFLTTGFHGLHVTGGLIASYSSWLPPTWPNASPTIRRRARSSCPTTGTSSTSSGSPFSS